MWKIILEFHSGFSAVENPTNGFSTRVKLLSNSTVDFLQKKIAQMDFPHVENYYQIRQGIFCKGKFRKWIFHMWKVLWDSIMIFCIRKIPQMDFPHVENYYRIRRGIFCKGKFRKWIFHMWKILWDSP